MSLKHKKVLVTGAGGFIGSHLAERLVEEGCDVTAMIRYSSTSYRGWLEASPLNKHMRFEYGDIVDPYFVRDVVKRNEIVFHLAALIGIPYSYVAPHQYVRTNVEGTVNVVHAAREFDVERVLQTSTSEVFGTALRTPIDEQHPTQPQSPYSASKISSDTLAESYYRAFDTPVVIIRPFNTFGPRQSMRAVIPTIIMQCLELGAIKLGNLTPTRDMNYVSNTVDGFVKAAMAPLKKVVGQHINLGTGIEYTIGQIAEMVAQKIGIEFEIEHEAQRKRPDKSEVYQLIADRKKAEDLLGWKPKVDFSNGLDKTIEWFRENRNLYRANEYTV